MSLLFNKLSLGFGVGATAILPTVTAAVLASGKAGWQAVAWAGLASVGCHHLALGTGLTQLTLTTRDFKNTVAVAPTLVPTSGRSVLPGLALAARF